MLDNTDQPYSNPTVALIDMSRMAYGCVVKGVYAFQLDLVLGHAIKIRRLLLKAYAEEELSKMCKPKPVVVGVDVGKDASFSMVGLRDVQGRAAEMIIIDDVHPEPDLAEAIGNYSARVEYKDFNVKPKPIQKPWWHGGRYGRSR